LSKLEGLLDSLVEEGNSVGAIVRGEISGVPQGLDEPVYNKINSKLAEAIMSINSVKGVDFGSEFNSINLLGDEYLDQMRMEKNQVKYLSNNAGGIVGGISTGEKIILTYVISPLSSIKKPLQTFDINGRNAEISVDGRHDPITAVRSIPVAEAMCSCVIADLKLQSSMSK